VGQFYSLLFAETHTCRPIKQSLFFPGYRRSGPARYNQSMLTRAQIIARRSEILAVAARNGASDIRIFGPVARGDAGATSDLDLLVRFNPDSSLMDHGMLVEELQQLLHIKVDIVSEDALKPRDRFRGEVLREAVPL
jgi:predicted nucleotidyltransferase